MLEAVFLSVYLFPVPLLRLELLETGIDAVMAVGRGQSGGGVANVYDDARLLGGPTGVLRPVIVERVLRPEPRASSSIARFARRWLFC